MAYRQPIDCQGQKARLDQLTGLGSERIPAASCSRVSWESMGPLSLRIATYATGITDRSCTSVAKEVKCVMTNSTYAVGVARGAGQRQTLLPALTGVLAALAATSSLIGLLTSGGSGRQVVQTARGATARCRRGSVRRRHLVDRCWKPRPGPRNADLRAAGTAAGPALVSAG